MKAAIKRVILLLRRRNMIVTCTYRVLLLQWQRGHRVRPAEHLGTRTAPLALAGGLSSSPGFGLRAIPIASEFFRSASLAERRQLSIPLPVWPAQSGRSHDARTLSGQSAGPRARGSVWCCSQSGQFFGNAAPAGALAAGTDLPRVVQAITTGSGQRCSTGTVALAGPRRFAVPSAAAYALGAAWGRQSRSAESGGAAALELKHFGGQTGGGGGASGQGVRTVGVASTVATRSGLRGRPLLLRGLQGLRTTG